MIRARREATSVGRRDFSERERRAWRPKTMFIVTLDADGCWAGSEEVDDQNPPADLDPDTPAFVFLSGVCGWGQTENEAFQNAQTAFDNRTDPRFNGSARSCEGSVL